MNIFMRYILQLTKNWIRLRNLELGPLDLWGGCRLGGGPRAVPLVLVAGGCKTKSDSLDNHSWVSTVGNFNSLEIV